MYRIFDISLECDIPLPELPASDGSGTLIRVAAGTGNERQSLSPEWFHEWQDGKGNVVMVCGRVADGYVLRFPGLVDFLVSSSCDQVRYFPLQELPGETLRHLLLDQLIPRVLGQQARFILHASAVQFPAEKAIAFVGDTGWGKSTLAASYYRKHARLVSDDCLLFEPEGNAVLCIPNYSGLRLNEDSSETLFDSNDDFRLVSHYSSKKRLILHAGNDRNDNIIPLGAIFVLSDPGKERGDAIRVNRIQGGDEMISIIRQQFLLDVTDKAIIAKQFNKAREIIDRVPLLFSLSYPRQYDRLESVHEAIAEALNPVCIST
ncbi:MAG TPA: hypothetical protein VJ981_05800 [Gammaproteobacteria bacterium]|nr:hypothetical protein [Gammaproteobacteria bacterium]